MTSRLRIVIALTLGLLATSEAAHAACPPALESRLVALAYSSSAIARLCANEKLQQLLEGRTDAELAPMFVYRGLGIEPENFLPNKTGNIGLKVWVSHKYQGIPYDYAITKYPEAQLRKALSEGKRAYGTLVEYELPKFLVGGDVSIGWINHDLLPTGAEDLPSLISRIGRVDVEVGKLRLKLQRGYEVDEEDLKKLAKPDLQWEQWVDCGVLIRD